MTHREGFMLSRSRRLGASTKLKELTIAAVSHPSRVASAVVSILIDIALWREIDRSRMILALEAENRFQQTAPGFGMTAEAKGQHQQQGCENKALPVHREGSLANKNDHHVAQKLNAR
jgi:hypothetical protein